MEIEIAQLDRKYQTLRIEDPTQQSRLMASLLEHGQRSAVIVVGTATPTRYVLIDGYQRVRALERLGRDLCEAVLLELGEVDALVMCQKLDGRRRLSALEEGWFLRELLDGHGLRPRELSLRLGRSPSWISRRLALVKILPAAVQQAVQQGRLRPQVAMKVLVPLARGNAEVCERLVARLGPEPWTVRQMERLYRAWRRADPEQRDRIIEHPELYRKVDEDLGEKAGSPTAKVMRDLGVLAGVSSRVRREIEAGALECIASGRQKSRIARAWRRTKEAFTELSIELEENLAGPGHTDGDLSAAPGGAWDPHHRPGAGDLAERGQAGPP